MEDEVRKQITRLLDAIGRGDDRAKEELYNLIYEELRRLAHSRMRQESPGHTWQTTDLLHQCFLKLDSAKVLCHAHNRRYLFGAAAKAMRRLVIEHARSRPRRADGGKVQKLPIDEIVDAFEQEVGDVSKLGGLLEEFATVNVRACQIFCLCFFAGLTHKEIADLLDVSEQTVRSDLRLARAWLYARIRADGEI